MSTILVIACIWFILTDITFSFHSHRNLNVGYRLSHIRMDSSSERSADLHDRLNSGEFSEAYQILKKNPLLHLTKDDAKILLNNIDMLVPYERDEDKRQKQIVEACTFLYRRLDRQQVVRGFGCIDEEYPEKSYDMTPAKLEEITGIPISSLTPKRRSTYWQLAGISLCTFEYFLGNSLGIDPLYTLIPGTFLLFGLDQLVWKGAAFETIYQSLFPEYKKKVICHEAGHFLISYLLGVPVRGCITNAWQSQKYPEIRGQAGTIFYDTKLNEEVATQKVTRSSLDRLSVIVMAGIAAEALKFGRAEGGVSDEQALVDFLTSLNPPWNLLRIQSKARWAAVQAILLIKEHQESYEALVSVLESGRDVGVGEAVLAIESHLPEVLPSKQRIEARKKSDKIRERDVLLRYVQRMTWRVGGIQSMSMSSSISQQQVSEDGFVLSQPEPPTDTDSSALVAIAAAVSGDSHSKHEHTDAAMEAVALADEAVKLFADKMKRLEQEVQNGRLDVSEGEGGIWLNGLKSLPKDDTNVSLPKDKVDVHISVALPDPIPGFEQRIEELLQSEVEVVTKEETAIDKIVIDVRNEEKAVDLFSAVSVPRKIFSEDDVLKSSSSSNGVNATSKSSMQVVAVPLMISPQRKSLVGSSDDEKDFKPRDMLKSNRGYQMKKLENIKVDLQKKVIKVENRLKELAQ